MNRLILICLILAFTSLITLYYWTSKIKIEEVPIEKIDSNYIGKTITTTGKVVSVSYNKGNIFLTVENRKQINVVIFSNVAKYLESYPKRGDNVIITGVVSEYKGKLQIIPRKPEDVVIK